MTLNILHTHKLGWDRASKWLGDLDGAKKWPYGMYRQTGGHSICSLDKLKNKGKSSSKAINNAAANKILGGPAGAPVGQGNGRLIPKKAAPVSNDDQDAAETPVNGPAKKSGGRNSKKRK